MMKRVVAFLVFSALACLAVSPVPAGSGPGVLSSSGTNTFTATCSAGTNLVEVVALLNQGTISVATSGGTAMTLAASYTGGTYPLYVYTIPLGASSGARTIIIVSTGQVISNWACYDGVNQTGQPEAKTLGQHTTGTTQNATITGVTATALLLGIYINDNGNPVTPGTGSSGTTVNVLRQLGPVGTNGYIQIVDSNTTTVTTGSNNFGVFAAGDYVSSQPIDGLVMSLGPLASTQVPQVGGFLVGP